MNRFKHWKLSLMVATVVVLGGMFGGFTTGVQAATTKALSLRETVSLVNHYNVFNVLAKLRVNKKGKLISTSNYGVGAKRYKKGWKLGYVGLVGGYRATVIAQPEKGNRKVKFTLKTAYAYSPKRETKRSVKNRYPKKSVWHRGLPKVLKHKQAFTKRLGTKRNPRLYMFQTTSKSMTEGLYQAGILELTEFRIRKLSMVMI